MTTTVDLPKASREITISRVFDAPRSLLFEVWTKAEHLDKWWGPEGFRNETQSMDFRVGGEWRYIMHGPDGMDFPNLMRFTEIVAPERIAYVLADVDADGEAADGIADGGTSFEGVTTFVELGPKRTEVRMHSIFPSAEERDRVIAEFGAVEGGKQTLARLAAYLQSVG